MCVSARHCYFYIILNVFLFIEKNRNQLDCWSKTELSGMYFWWLFVHMMCLYLYGHLEALIHTYLYRHMYIYKCLFYSVHHQSEWRNKTEYESQIEGDTQNRTTLFFFIILFFSWTPMLMYMYTHKWMYVSSKTHQFFFSSQKFFEFFF